MKNDRFDPIEATVDAIHTAMEAGTITSLQLVETYLQRIEEYDSVLNSIVTVNPDVRDRAKELDSRFERRGSLGPLHGVPVLLKDNQNTHDMPTTAGSDALVDCEPSADAFIVENLRDAGAIILGKTNLDELAYGVNTVSSYGGATKNAYDPNRRPGGSSGGTAAAIAANLAAIGTGTDTCSSIRSPPAFNGLVGVRPTRGLVSRSGVVPLSRTQDTVGPITRTVADAARVLDVIAGFDPGDPTTSRGSGQMPSEGYLSHLDRSGLDGARIGVVREFMTVQDDTNRPGDTVNPVIDVIEEAIEDMAASGATIVDPVTIPNIERIRNDELISFEFRPAFDRYLSERNDEIPYASLEEIIDSGKVVSHIESEIRDAGVLDSSREPLAENEAYLRRRHHQQQHRESIQSLLADKQLDAVVYPPSTVPPVEIPAYQPFEEMNCELAAHTGLPAIVVPAGSTPDGLPVGIEMLGTAFSEPRLFELAYAYEQATGNREPPERFGPL